MRSTAKLTKQCSVLCLNLLLGFAGTAAAQIVGQSPALGRNLDFSSSVSIGTRYDNNANRASGDEEALGEQQNIGNVSVAASFTGDRQFVNLDYRLTAEEYAEGSRENDAIYTGSAQYLLGSERTFYGLNVTHSVDRVLNSPSSEFFIEDSRSQSTLRIRPSIKTTNFGSNLVELSAVFGEVTSEDSEVRDVTEKGTELRWNRDLPSIYQAGLVVGSFEYDFSESSVTDTRASNLDYSSRSAMVYLQAESRNLEYSVSVGRQRIERDLSGQSFEGGVYSISVNYEVAGQEFTYRDSLILSDTSFSEAPSGFESDAVFGGASLTQDNIQQYSREFIWATNLLCQRCRFSLSGTEQDVVYFEFPINNFVTTTFTTRFEFDYSRRSTITLSYGYRDTELEFDSDQDASDGVSRLSYSRRFFRRAEMDIYLEHVERDDATGGYEAGRAGLTLSYTFD